MPNQFVAGTPVKFSISPKNAKEEAVSVADGLTDVSYVVTGPAVLVVADDKASAVATPTGLGSVTVTVSAVNKIGETLTDSVTVEFVAVVKTLNLAAVAA